MTRRPMGPHAVQHFANGLLAIVGETRPRRVSLCILGNGNPGGTLRVSGSAQAMGQLAHKLAMVALAVRRER